MSCHLPAPHTLSPRVFPKGVEAQHGGLVLSFRRDPFGLALGHLRRQLATGAIWPGQSLIIQDLAADLKLSPTPVREALARLAGEGLIEVRQGGGYRLWSANAVDLADLYEAHLSALLSSLRVLVNEPGRRVAYGEAKAVEGPSAESTEAAFDALARACGNRVLVAWRRSLAQRLGWARRVEGLVFDDLNDEAAGLVRDLALATDPGAQARIVAAFHRRRRDGAELIARALRDLGSATKPP